MSRVFQALERVDGLRGRKAPTVMDAPGKAERLQRSEPSEPGEFERLAATVLQAKATAPFTTLMLASPQHGEGTSTVVANLGRVLAARMRVLLVDANFRSPGLTDLLHHEGIGAGLVEALTGRADGLSVVSDTEVPNLRLIPAGLVEMDSPRLLQSARLSMLLAQVAATADLVVVDAPPVMPYADALTLASKVERIVLVTHAEHTQRGHLEQAKGELDKSGAAFLGVVLNRKATHAPSWLQRRFNL